MLFIRIYRYIDLTYLYLQVGVPSRQRRGKPINIRVDSGPENISAAQQNWVAICGISLTDIQPGKPEQNGYFEIYNRTVRREWLG